MLREDLNPLRLNDPGSRFRTQRLLGSLTIALRVLHTSTASFPLLLAAMSEPPPSGVVYVLALFAVVFLATTTTTHAISSPIRGTDLIIDGWFHERGVLWPGQAMSLQVEKVLDHHRSKFQDVLVFQSSHHGTVLVLDGTYVSSLIQTAD